MAKTFDEMKSDEVIDVRDMIERIEELESSFEDHESDPEGGHWSDEDAEELAALKSVMDDIAGYGGDEQWRGDWYPIPLIADWYFTDYVEDMVIDCYGLPKDMPAFIEIDWEATAKNVRVDYSSVEIGGSTFWYR